MQTRPCAILCDESIISYCGDSLFFGEPFEGESSGNFFVTEQAYN